MSIVLKALHELTTTPFLSLYGNTCSQCSAQFIKNEDWMRTAGRHKFHIACFVCKVCRRQLSTAEKYHLVNGTDIYCVMHYKDMVNGDGE